MESKYKCSKGAPKWAKILRNTLRACNAGDEQVFQNQNTVDKNQATSAKGSDIICKQTLGNLVSSHRHQKGVPMFPKYFSKRSLLIDLFEV